MMYKVTRNIYGVRPSYIVEAASPRDAVKVVESFLGGPFGGLEAVEETDAETEASEQEAAVR